MTKNAKQAYYCAHCCNNKFKKDSKSQSTTRKWKFCAHKQYVQKDVLQTLSQ